jgi:hypothetical protein
MGQLTDNMSVLEYGRRQERIAIKQQALLDSILETLGMMEQSLLDDINGRPYLFKTEVLERLQTAKKQIKLSADDLQKELDS